MNVIANKKGTQEWFICEIEGRKPCPELTELVNTFNILLMYEKDLESEYYQYYKIKSNQ